MNFKKQSMLLLAVSFALAATQVQAGASHGSVTAEQDEFDEYPIVTAKGIKLSAGLELWGVATQGGSSGAYLVLQAKADSWQYLRCNSLTLLADGTRLRVETTHDGTVGRGYVLEYVSFTLKAPDLRKLAHASTLKGKLCNTVFGLSPAQIGTLKKFYETSALRE